MLALGVSIAKLPMPMARVDIMYEIPWLHHPRPPPWTDVIVRSTGKAKRGRSRSLGVEISYLHEPRWNAVVWSGKARGESQTS